MTSMPSDNGTPDGRSESAARSRRRPPRSPLTSKDVHRVIATRAAREPLPTTAITNICQAAHPTYWITAYEVAVHLRYLERRGRVQRLRGAQDVALLEALGVVDPKKRSLYWRLPPLTQPDTQPLTDDLLGGHLDDDLPMSDDGREPFPVTDDLADAPWGAVLDLTDMGRPGWWQRQGGSDGAWIPVERPGRRDT